jgi:hypothetical protein
MYESSSAAAAATTVTTSTRSLGRLTSFSLNAARMLPINTPLRVFSSASLFGSLGHDTNTNTGIELFVCTMTIDVQFKSEEDDAAVVVAAADDDEAAADDDDDDDDDVALDDEDGAAGDALSLLN